MSEDEGTPRAEKIEIRPTVGVDDLCGTASLQEQRMLADGLPRPHGAVHTARDDAAGVRIETLRLVWHARRTVTPRRKAVKRSRVIRFHLQRAGDIAYSAGAPGIIAPKTSCSTRRFSHARLRLARRTKAQSRPGCFASSTLSHARTRNDGEFRSIHSCG